MTTSTVPTAAKRKEIVRHGPSSLNASCWRTVGQTEGRGTTLPSHHAGGESSHRLRLFVHGHHSRRKCSEV
jgi:hypothetical protein